MDENLATTENELTESSSEAVLRFWQQFHLFDKRAEWDKISNEMRDFKSASINGRKRLNEMTKAFRARPKEEQLLAMSELLKAYQEEIDQLSKRSRFTETSFANIHRAFYDAPDPAPYMESLYNTVNNGTSHSLEIERLKTEIRQYDEEFQRLKNQDITIRRLEDQLQEYKDNLEEKIIEEAERRVRIVRDQCEQQLIEGRDAQRSAEKRLQQAVDAAKVAQQSLDRIQSQLFEENQRTESRLSAMILEHNTLLDQNQRLSIRIAELENEKSSISNSDTSGRISSSSAVGSGQQWQIQREAMEQLLQTQQDQLRVMEDQLRQDRTKQDSFIRELQQTVGKEREHVQRLKSELSKAATRAQYNTLRRELKTLRRIAFHTEEEEDEESDENNEFLDIVGVEDFTEVSDDLREDDIDRPAAVDDMLTPEKTPMKKPSAYQTPNKNNKQEVQKKKKPGNSVEDLLAKRLRIVEHELAVSRSDLADAKMQESQARESAEKYRKLVDTTQIQLQKAEQDLEQRSVALEQLLARQSQQKHGEATSNTTGTTSSNKMDDDLALLLLGSGDQGMSNHNNKSNKNRVNKQVPGNLTQKQEASGSMANNSDNADSQQLMIKVLQTQRDRTKERLASCESRLLSVQQQLDHEISQKQQLEQDNLSLYRKVKFLQSYHNNNGIGSVGMGDNFEGRYIDDPYRVSDRSNRDGSSSMGGDIESRYGAMYEERLSPFAAFSSAEKQRKWRELSTADRIVLNTAMAVVTNSTGRTFLLIYFGAMHLLVFGTMYYLAHAVPHGNIVQCITDPHQAQLH